MRYLFAEKLPRCTTLIFIFLIQSSGSPPGIAQDFYPLHVGDIWQYKSYSQGEFVGYSTQTVIKDTVMLNGKRYFVFDVERFVALAVRMDDSLISYRYDSWNMDSDTSTTELIMNRFGAPVGATWRSFQAPPAGGTARMEDSYNTVWFNEPIELRKISYWQDWNGSQLFVAYNYFSKKHGLVYSALEGDEQQELTGARIGGVVYGVIMSVAHRQINTLEGFHPANPYPNPFNSSTTVEYTLSRQSVVSIRIFGILGNLVKTFGDEKKLARKHVLTWSLLDDGGRRLPSGVYFLRVNNGIHAVVKKIIALQ